MLERFKCFQMASTDSVDNVVALENLPLHGPRRAHATNDNELDTAERGLRASASPLESFIASNRQVPVQADNQDGEPSSGSPASHRQSRENQSLYNCLEENVMVFTKWLRLLENTIWSAFCEYIRNLITPSSEQTQLNDYRRIKQERGMKSPSKKSLS